METSSSIKKEDTMFIHSYYTTEEKTGEKNEDINYLVDHEEDDGDECFSKPYFTPNSATTRPMEGLYEPGPTPFLKKTFEMVEDPTTNGIISWSGSKKSFVVWDYHHFSTHLLPKHFKHNNFSSFIRQLNTYGFKKIDPERWEFANEGFQEGQKHMLKHIKRRKQIPQTKLESEIEKLNKESSKLIMEISKLKDEQKRTQGCLTAMKERLKNNEFKQQKMFVFMANALSNPGFLQKFITMLRHQRGLIDDTPIAKKQRVIDPHEENQNHEELATVDSETDKLFPPSLDEEGSSGSEGPKGKCTSSGQDLGCENHMSWTKFWEEEFVMENKVQGDGEFGESHSNFDVELGDLITKPSEQWANYMKDMVVQVADVT